MLDNEAGKFCKELWVLCLSAQDSPLGVAKELLEQKKLELQEKKVTSMPENCCCKKLNLL